MTYVMRPTVDDLLERAALTEANYPRSEAQSAYDAAWDEQVARCVVDPYTSALAEAFLRRCLRVMAARNAPLGVTDMGDFGTQNLLRWDAKTDELEADYLKGGFA